MSLNCFTVLLASISPLLKDLLENPIPQGLKGKILVKGLTLDAWHDPRYDGVNPKFLPNEVLTHVMPIFFYKKDLGFIFSL